jgi:hypothetical protein
MIGSSSTSGIQVSNLAALCAPPGQYQPAKMLAAGCLLSGIAGFFTIFVIGMIFEATDVRGNWSIKLALCLALASGIAVMTWAYRRAASFRKYNLEVWPGLEAEWRKRWICSRCHDQFVPPA